MSRPDELTVPDGTESDPKAFEVIRVWIANKGLHVSLRTGVWQDPFAYGVMLSDLMKHIANAYQQEQGLDPLKTLQRIKAGLDAESSSPADRPSGRVS
jgi:Domain of unknown function (DUF5076)